MFAPLCANCASARRRGLAHRPQQGATGDERQQQHRQSPALAAGRGGDRGNQRGTDKRRYTARQGVEPEKLGTHLGRREACHERSAGGLHRSDEQAEGGAEDPEQRRTGRAHRTGGGNEQPHQRDQDRAFRADAIVHPAKGRRTNSAGQVQHDAEHQNLGLRQSEHARREDAANDEDGHQTIRVDHVGDEEAHDVGVLPHLTQGRPQGPQPLAHVRCKAARVRTAIGREQKQRRGEHGEPQGSHGGDDADVLEGCLVEAEPRLLGLHECHQRNRHRYDATGVAKPPRPSAPAADARGWHQVRQHGVGENDAKFDTQVADRIEQHAPGDERRIGFGPPQHRRAEHGDAGEQQEPRFAPPARVRDGTQHRRQHRDKQAAGAGRPAPSLLACDRILDYREREVGRKDERDDERCVCRVRPVKQRPCNARARPRFAACIA